MKINDLTNQEFGRLTAIHPTGKTQGRHIIWECKCICGNVTEVNRGDLVRKRTRSCGCYKNELLIKRTRKGREESGRNTLMSNYKWGAKRRSLEFSLTKDQFHILTSQKCHYCEVEPQQVCGKNYRLSLESQEYSACLYNGIDRKDNNIGYIINNCVTCCKECNYMKHNYLTYTQMLELKPFLIKFRKENTKNDDKPIETIDEEPTNDIE